MPSVDRAAGHGDELVLQRAEIAGDQREQIGRLRERIVPDREMPAVGELACRDRIAVGQQQRRLLGVGLDADRVDGQDVRPVEEIGDAAKALGLALRAIDAARAVEPHQRLVAGRRDLGLDGQLEAARRRRLGDHQAVRRGGERGRCRRRRRRSRGASASARRRRAPAATSSGVSSRRSMVSLAMTARRVRRKPEGEVGLRDEIRAGAIVFQAKDLAGVGSHSATCS